MKTLKDKTAVVTGGGGGIGRAIALALAENGTNVMLADIDEDSARAVAVEVRSRGVRSAGMLCDVSKPDSVASLADKTFAEFGAVDILCNNAGVTWRPYRSIFDTTLEDMQFIFRINFWGVVHGLMAFLPRMRQQPGEKHIVNTASVGGLLPVTGMVPYGTSKAAVCYLSETVAQEVAPHGFGMTILCPGFVPTNIADNSARVRGEQSRGDGPTFEPVPTPMLDRFRSLAIDSAEVVGVMVRNAILANTLYVHTKPLPGDLIVDRLYAQFGSGSTGQPQ
jgi:NAD(P)-dependent dehydrogenase (short-subunit alcohol dehydrogenase family)